MIIIENKSNSASFNLALEQHLLYNYKDEIFMLWQNEPSIIVGKNQNAAAEINEEAVRKLKIPVVRRITGGGTVFHDLGNINYTFILNDNDGAGNFALCCEPIIEYLKSLGIDASLSGRNDMVIGDKKFSGNAQCVHKGRLLHHGTLLFSGNIQTLTEVLTVNPLKIQSKGIKSVSSRVTNIAEHLKTPMTVEQFIAGIEDFISKKYPDMKVHKLTQEDIAQCNKLVEERYGNWEWNFGASPKYMFHNGAYLKCGFVEAALDIRDGYIEKAEIKGDFFFKKDICELCEKLVGIRHEFEQIKALLEQVKVDDYIVNADADEIARLML